MAYFSSSQKLKLARSFITKASPLYVQYYVTARCNLACEQCNINFANADCPEMTIAQIRAMAKNMADIGVCIVLLIGGEPFARKDLPEIVKTFTDVGIHVRLQTNGFASRKSIDQCLKNGAHDISISLDTLNESLQDAINGNMKKSWDRAIETIALVNELFPDNGSAFFGTVLMPKNIFHIHDVMEFANQIGWGVSLVPVHATTPEKPRGFRIFDETGAFAFPQPMVAAVKKSLDMVKEKRKAGFTVYDSDEYLDDCLRFISNEPVQWRRRNNDVCDSPHLYFSIRPDGSLQPCCDYTLESHYPVYDKNFPHLYRSGLIHSEVYAVTHDCTGCMFGSYPEITVTARYMKPFIERFFLFNSKIESRLKKHSSQQMKELARSIVTHNKNKRELLEKEYGLTENLR